STTTLLLSLAPLLARAADPLFRASFLSYPATPFAASQLAMADFDADGRLDVAVPLHGSRKVSVLRGLGSAGFGAESVYPVGNGPTALAIGDLDGDGKADLAVANDSSNTVSILLGAGNGA